MNPTSNAQIDRHLDKDEATGIYYVKFKGKDNRTHRRSTRASRIEEAREVVRHARIIDLELAAKANALTAETLSAIMAGRKVTALDAVNEWENWRTNDSSPGTIRSMKLIIMQWIRGLKAENWPVAKFTFAHIDAFINDDDGTKKSNRDFRLTAVRSYFKFCNALGYCVGNPAMLARVKLNLMSHEQKETTKRVPITEREYKHIMAHTTGFLRWSTALGYWVGLRLSDIAGLEWAAITPTELIVWTRKSEKRVALPLADPLIGGNGALQSVLLEILMQSHHDKYCFPAERATNLDPTKRARHSVYYARMLEELGIEGKSFHCLRHSFQTRLDRAGRSIEDIGRLVGHSSSETTKGYIHKDAKL